MDWIVGILLLLVGMVAGFFVANYLRNKQTDTKGDQKTEQTIKEIMTQQAAEHLRTSRQTLETLQQQCNTLSQQMDMYEELLNEHNRTDPESKLNYFGEHTTLYLRNKQGQQKREKVTADVQPRDFANEGSGLFDGSKSHQSK